MGRKVAIVATIIIVIVLAALVVCILLGRSPAPTVVPPQRPPGFNPGGPRVPAPQGRTGSARVVAEHSNRPPSA